MTFAEWLEYGVEQGWCSEPVCDTHQGLPLSGEEAEAWEEGWDPCVHAVRVYGDG